MAKLLNVLDLIWTQQRKYNDKVRAARPLSYEGWMEKYLLGVTSEMNEVLNEINWKAHRRGKPIDRVNLARELADLTKYVFSLWEWSGFTSQDMLAFVIEKSEELDAQWSQDFETVYTPGCPIVIADIDGTLADYRSGFYTWLQTAHQSALPEDQASTLAMEVDLGLSYPIYVRYKEEFESTGGYNTLPIYPDISQGLLTLNESGVELIAYTARPSLSFSRIWNDTWGWLRSNNIASYFKELRMGKEQRIARACELMAQGHRVALLEDEPDTALRAAAAGVTVFMRSQPYNYGIQHARIIRFDTFPTGIIQICLEVENEEEK